MPRSHAQGKAASNNRILDALPSRELNQLLPHLEPVALTFKQVLWERGAPIMHIYFPLQGVVSLICPPEGQDHAMEVGVVGKDGMLGLPRFLETETAFFRYVVQVAGDALVIGAHEFHTTVRREGKLFRLLLRYAQAFVMQLSQSIACISQHPVEQRLCRWLLAVQDRVGTDNFPLTHEFLAAMLGCRRASVTDVARHLREQGLIRYTRRTVKILDRRGLEAAACDCYAKIHAAQERVFV